MSLLCSVLCCSYKRPDFLVKMLKSLHDGATASRFEVIVRLSESDPESLQRQPEFLEFGNVRIVTGPQMRGYIDHHVFLTEAAALAVGERVSIIDDDMTIEGGRWDDELAKLPLCSFATCEFYQISACNYPSGSCGPTGWFIPNGCWREFGHRSIGFPPDTWMKQLLVDQQSWPLSYLKGIRLNHQWQRPGEEAVRRGE